MPVAGRVVANLVYRSLLVLSLSVLPAAALTGSAEKPATKHPAKPAATKPHAAAPADTAKKDDAKGAKKPVDKPKPRDTDTAAKGGKYFQDLIQLPAPSDRSAQDIAAMMGDPKPFTLSAKDAHTIVIYCEAADPKTCDAGLLQTIEANISRLAGGKLRSLELTVVHTESMNDVLGQIKALNYSGLQIQAVGPDRIRITSTSDDDANFRQFQRDLLRLEWRPNPQSPVARVFYIKADDAAKALGSGVTSVGPASDDGSAADGGGASDGGDDSGDSADKSTKAAGGAKSAKKAGGSGDGGKGKPTSTASVATDMLVFSDAHPGDDEDIAEKKRILAALDFPRPEVIINTFSFQTSASDPQVVVQANEQLQSAIGGYNDALQAALYRAWFYLEKRISEHNFFDPGFHDYLTKRYVGRLPASTPTDDEQRFELCNPNTYCLGYTSLFDPLRPSLTDLLLAVIAASSPGTEFNQAADVMQGFSYSEAQRSGAGDWSAMTCDRKDVQAWSNPDQFWNQGQSFRASAMGPRAESAQPSTVSKHNPKIFPMFCFREAVQAGFPTGDADITAAKPLRAAFANFLFQYKLSQQYPHEFSGYDLSQAAQELNAELNPLIVAFNRDLAAALSPLQQVAAADPKGNGWLGFSGHGTRFINNGIITVRTVSGKETVVDTVTQSFFDATNPPSITDVINSIGQAEKNTPAVLKANLSANEAAVIIGALNSVKPATSKVGREFKIDVTPHSLSGASSAELDVSLNTSESAEPTLYSDGKSSSDNLSRVGVHTTVTKVRLESIKLFEISSFTAVLQRSRRNFPLLPPFVEIPYIGSIFSVPLPGAKEYHRSTAIMSAVVVPTAADLANGIAFTKDRVLVSPERNGSDQACTLQDVLHEAGEGKKECRLEPALSLRDIPGSISEFNKAMVRCLSEPKGLRLNPDCNLTFDDVLSNH